MKRYFDYYLLKSTFPAALFDFSRSSFSVGNMNG